MHLGQSPRVVRVVEACFPAFQMRDSACAGPTSVWAKFSIAGESRDAPLGPDTMARSGLRTQTLSSARPDPRRRGCGGRSASCALCGRRSRRDERENGQATGETTIASESWPTTPKSRWFSSSALSDAVGRSRASIRSRQIESKMSRSTIATKLVAVGLRHLTELAIMQAT